VAVDHAVTVLDAVAQCLTDCQREVFDDFRSEADISRPVDYRLTRRP
jgi:hypothetical protein